MGGFHSLGLASLPSKLVLNKKISKKWEVSLPGFGSPSFKLVLILKPNQAHNLYEQLYFS
jgi:hypothetical protein